MSGVPPTGGCTGANRAATLVSDAVAAVGVEAVAGAARPIARRASRLAPDCTPKKTSDGGSEDCGAGAGDESSASDRPAAGGAEREEATGDSCPSAKEVPEAPIPERVMLPLLPPTLANRSLCVTAPRLPFTIT
jgi:hypothetical protein